MLLRRMLGLLLTFTMANVAAVGGDLSCEKHSAHAGQASPTADMAHMNHGGPASTAPNPEKGQCDAPATTRCCEAVTSCAVVMVLESSNASAESPIAASLILPSVDEIPVSRVVAPDPPPPKA